ncbi:MobA/MobL family protein [Lachnospiraceae bacterium]|nr:MobA/MobL family protein [Lachnospiraceae bacterium]
MQRHSFIQMTKLPNVKGRISYITSNKKQEYLYATYDTADGSFWNNLAKCNQTEFAKNGTSGRCIEARELIIALPESFTSYKEDQLLKYFVDKFKDKYKVECVAALHHNKRKTNYHIHLIFSERRLLDEPIEKTATRNMFYDETGKHVRTKKEIMDEDGNIRKKCKIVKKGEVYERIIFDKKDIQFKQDDFLEKAKVFITEEINILVKNPDEKLKVFDRNGVYLPMKKIGKNNPKAEEIKQDNEERTRWNKTVDQALVSDITEKEILEIKKEHITKPVKESIKERGEQPSLFKIILEKAISVLEKLIIKVKEAAVKAAEIIKEAATKTEKIVESVITEVKEEIENVTSTKNVEATEVTDKTSEKTFVELIEEPERPVAPILDYDINQLLAIYDILQDKNKEIYAAQKRKNDKMIELDDTSKFNFVKRSGLSVEIQNLERAIEEMQGELSETVQKYGFNTVREFMNVLRNVKKAVTDYQLDMKNWKEMSEIIKNTNAMILSRELTIDFAIELLEQRGYKTKIIKKDIHEIPKDSSLFAKLSRAKQRADERNENRNDKRLIRDKKIR